MHLCSKDSLPYVFAIMKELLRWNIIAPLGVPRASTEDDVYNGQDNKSCSQSPIISQTSSHLGYRIPKGSVILANYW